jgi:TRAP-type C4-dicarboxylate transport system permease large subunit
MDVMTITVAFIPIVLPLVNALGIDLVYFGVVVVLNMMIGLSTPPFGGCCLLFRESPKRRFTRISKRPCPTEFGTP